MKAGLRRTALVVLLVSAFPVILHGQELETGDMEDGPPQGGGACYVGIEGVPSNRYCRTSNEYYLQRRVSYKVTWPCVCVPHFSEPYEVPQTTGCLQTTHTYLQFPWSGSWIHRRSGTTRHEGNSVHCSMCPAGIRSNQGSQRCRGIPQTECGYSWASTTFSITPCAWHIDESGGMCRPRGWSEQRTEPWDSYWGTISTVQLTTACCEDFDGDGIAAHQFCGSESGLIDCDDSDPTVGHDCELRVESVSFDFTRRYKDLVAASSVDLQHFDAPETIGAAEDCSGTADTNGDGYTPAQSYRCSPPPPGEEAHQVSEEFPIANVKVGVEKSEFVCVPTVSLGAWNEPEGRGVRVAIERKRGGGPWTKLYETELRAEWCLGNQDPRCAVLYTARQSDRGSLLRCVVRPKGGGAQAPPYSRREKVAYAAVAHRTLLGLSARANVRGSYSIYLYQPRLRAPRPNLFIDVSSASSATGATPEALKRALESASSKLDENSFRWRTKRIYLRHDPMVPAPFLFTAQPTPTLVLGGEINSENVFRVGVIVVKVGLADVRRSTRIVVGASNQVRRIATWRTNAGDLPIVLFEGFGSDEVTAFGREYSVTLVTHEGKDLRLTIHPSVPVMFEPSEANSPEGEFSDTYVWIRNSIGGSDLGGVLAHELGHALAVTHGRMFCDEYNREMHREQNEVYGCMNRLSECCSRAPDMAGSCRISVSNASNRIECYGAPYLTPDLMLDAEHGEAPFRSIMGPASLNEGDFHIFPSGIRGHSCPARTNPYQPGCAHVLNPQE